MKRGTSGDKPSFTERIGETATKQDPVSEVEVAQQEAPPAVLAPPEPGPGAQNRPMKAGMWGSVPHFRCEVCNQDTFNPEVAKQHRC